MSDTSNQDGKSTTGEPTSDAGDKFSPITTQDELNAVLGPRLERERAKFADYREIKAKADQLDKLTEASKSDLEKAEGRATSAEDRASKAEIETLRLRTAIAHGITIEDADLFLTGTDAETLTAQAKRLADRQPKRNVVPKEGTTPRVPADDDGLREFTRRLFAGSKD